MGAAVTVLSFDKMEVTTITEPLGNGQQFDTYSTNVQGTYAHNISDRFTAGASVKWAHENVFGVSSDAYQFDFGTNYHTTFAGRGIRLAFVVQNLGTNFNANGSRLELEARPPDFPTFPNSGELPLEFRTQDFRPPTTLKTALAYYLLESESSSFIVNAEFAAPRQLETTYSVGGEWAQTLIPANNGGVATTVAARAGYTYQQDEEDLGDSPNDNDVFRGLGFGVVQRGQRVDHALLPLTPVEDRPAHLQLKLPLLQEGVVVVAAPVELGVAGQRQRGQRRHQPDRGRS